MKSQNVKNKILGIVTAAFIGAAFSFSIHTAPPKKKFKGIWQYRTIIKGDKIISGFDNSDTMLISKENFSYRISKLNKNEHGRYLWKKVPKDSSPYGLAMLFVYNTVSKRSPPNTRLFNLMLVSDSLVIREGQTYFCYNRKKQ